jgi:hypothetical protein
MKISEYKKRFPVNLEMERLGQRLIGRIGAPITNSILEDVNAFYRINSDVIVISNKKVHITFWAASPSIVVNTGDLPQKLEYDGWANDKPEISVVAFFYREFYTKNNGLVTYRYKQDDWSFDSLGNAVREYEKLYQQFRKLENI